MQSAHNLAFESKLRLAQVSLRITHASTSLRSSQDLILFTSSRFQIFEPLCRQIRCIIYTYIRGADIAQFYGDSWLQARECPTIYF